MGLGITSHRVVWGMIAAGGVLLSSASVEASVIGAFWAFQPATNTPADSVGPAYTTVNAETFAGTPTLTPASASTPRSFSSPLPASYTDFQGTTWQAGRNLGWDSGYINNSLTLVLNTTGVKDLNLRFNYRSTTGGITAFTQLAYSLDGGATFTPIASVPGFTANSVWNVYTHDLSAVDAIENQASVILRWSLPNIPVSTTFRMDNFEVTATLIPEPATLALAGMGMVLLFVRQRR